MLYFLNIQEDPVYDLIETLRKIESNLNYMCEGRNLLVDRYQRMPLSKKVDNDHDIEAYESKMDKLRKDIRMAALKKEAERQTEKAKDKQREKAQKIIEYTVF